MSEPRLKPYQRGEADAKAGKPETACPYAPLSDECMIYHGAYAAQSTFQNMARSVFAEVGYQPEEHGL